MSLSLPTKLLKQHLNRVFVETGTHIGSGVELALDCGFEQIHSIEKNRGFFKVADAKFRGNKKVFLYEGDSREILPAIIEGIDEPITFWLDAHIDPAEKDPKKQVPLIEELRAIEGHHLNTHTILIDDRKQLGKHQDNFLKGAWTGVTEEDVLRTIARINPNYSVYFEDNKFSRKQIIVATLKQKKRSWPWQMRKTH